VDVYDLAVMARQAGLRVGVVLDPRERSSQLQQEVRRLERKVEAGAQFVVTQPVYDEVYAQRLRDATSHIEIPKIMGILPLRSARHARFLDRRVAGITVPQHIQQRIQEAADPAAEGAAGAKEMLEIAREWYSGACIMPAFDGYQVLFEILEASTSSVEGAPDGAVSQRAYSHLAG
jgi:homocysteine S-methyltransferase